jgi:hypothetical protein
MFQPLQGHLQGARNLHLRYIVQLCGVYSVHNAPLDLTTQTEPALLS